MLQKLKIARICSLFLLFVGIVLVSYMVMVENELGAFSLLIISSGIIWFSIIQFKIKKLKNNKS